MHPDVLNVSVLYGNGTPDASIPKLLQSLPMVQVLAEAKDPKELLSQPRVQATDLVMVDLDGAVPEWLEDVTRGLPQSTVLLCSQSRDPDFLIRAMRLGAREFLPLPLVRGDLETALERVRAAKKARFAQGENSGRLVVVTGLKGGVGTTSIAVNLAASLAEDAPNRVALVDLGRPFPDVAKFLDQERKTSLLDLVQNKNHLDKTFILKTLQPHKAKLSVLHGPEFTETGLVDPAVFDRLWGILRTIFEWIVVDLSHWLDELYLRTMREADQVLLLTELTVPHLQNLKTLWSILQHQGLEKGKVRVVVNRYHKTGGLGLGDVERIQKQPVFFTLPSDYPALSEAINYGAPLTEVAPRSKLCRSLRRLAEELMAHCAHETAAPVPAQLSKRRFLFF